MAAHLSCNRQSELFAKAPSKARLGRGGQQWVVRCRGGAFLALGLAVLGLNAPAQAQSYPSKTVTIVVSIGAGTGMDVLARLYGEKLSAALGKPVVVENKPGAATMLAANAVATSPPDGHTLVVLTSAALAINPTLYKQISYDPNKDFIPISLYVKSPFILVVNPDLPVKTVPELHQARQGSQAAAELCLGRRWRLAAPVDGVHQATGSDCDATHVPYRNTGQSVTDIAAGHVGARLRRGRRLDSADQGRQASRACGVVIERLPLLPDVPPFSEAASAA